MRRVDWSSARQQASNPGQHVPETSVPMLDRLQTPEGRLLQQDQIQVSSRGLAPLVSLQPKLNSWTASDTGKRAS